MEIGRFPCTGPRELYEGVSRIPWEQWLDPDGYVSVHGHVRHPMIRNSMYANQLVKDALCDRMVDRMGRRPILVPIDPGWWLICIGPVTSACIWMRRAGN